MIHISESAQAHFTNLLKDQPANTQIRVFVINPGTADAECGVSYCPPDTIEPTDTLLPCQGFDAVIDQTSLPFLKDADIDYVTEQLGAQLTLKAPNAKLNKIDGDAPLMERISYVIQTDINPSLAGHGGHINLLEITEDGYAIIQFGGGCNGCSMVDVTLKEGIEKQLLETFKGELKGIKDATEHQRGDHSYY
ncbi:MAG: Fe-S biogenesis protein NfuA [Shewanellaceae bacterium]|nr:Fe-S biogenesis protein NfuA [Shewanellaceae bacterium]